MAKTVVAMLVGVALSEGGIRSLDDRAEQYVAELKGTPYGETSIRHLLTMSSGVRFLEVYSGTDNVAELWRLSLRGESQGGAATVLPFRTRERAPGQSFQYASADTQVLGLVLRVATGKPLADYLSEKIWQPMGAEADATWLVDEGGYEAAFTGINATLRDYARLGMLLANDGRLDGRQIIPAGWVLAATTPSAKQFEPGKMKNFMGSGYSLFGYGYQTWLIPGKERQFMLRGVRGQGVFVDPGSKLVMVHTSAGNLSGDWGELLALWLNVSKAFGN
jgi:CubicO group peptidase (beta-lactamase class C family)